MSVERTRDPEHSHVRLDFGDLNLFTGEGAETFRQTVASTPEEVSVLAVAAAQPSEGVRGLSAGLDLEWASDLTPHEGYALLEAFYDAIQAVRELDAVAVCGCGDYTLGVGVELALACDTVGHKYSNIIATP